MLTHITIRLDEAARDIILAGVAMIRDSLRDGTTLPSETVALLTRSGTREMPTLDEVLSIRRGLNMTAGPDEDDEEDPEVRDLSLGED